MLLPHYHFPHAVVPWMSNLNLSVTDMAGRVHDSSDSVNSINPVVPTASPVLYLPVVLHTYGCLCGPRCLWHHACASLDLPQRWHVQSYCAGGILSIGCSVLAEDGVIALWKDYMPSVCPWRWCHSTLEGLYALCLPLWSLPKVSFET